jgi:hypothetical protein
MEKVPYKLGIQNREPVYRKSFVSDYVGVVDYEQYNLKREGKVYERKKKGRLLAALKRVPKTALLVPLMMLQAILTIEPFLPISGRRPRCLVFFMMSVFLQLPASYRTSLESWWTSVPAESKQEW